MTLTTERPSEGSLDQLDHSEKKPRGNSRIRKDIEGLRAVATFLVLPFHAGLMLFPGGFVGVDVFFVISGFVITGQLLKEADRDGKVSLLGFYARRAKRLLPASAVVLAATAVMTWLWVPKIRWETTGGDIVSAALYVVNWRLADRSVNYLAEGTTPSAVQHYWSLAVEEQFYFVWPILVLGALLVAARTQLTRRGALLGALALVALPSLLWAGHLAIAQPERAYFVTTARMWEFTLGALVAILAAKLPEIPRLVALVMAWGGLAMILVSARLYTSDMTWPGYPALVPTAGAALLIAGGVAAGERGPVAILGNRFMLTIGYLTYSLYLWHWPLLIVAREHFGGISVPVGLLIVTLSVIPAWLTFHFVENPLRNSRLVARDSRIALGVGVNATLAGVVAGLALIVALAGAITTLAPGTALGAAALGNAPTKSPAGVPAKTVNGGITPDPLRAIHDIPDLYDEGCQQSPDSDEPVSCSYGDPDAKTTIAVVGDSKAAQWVPAFQLLASRHDWHVITFTKSSCQFAPVDQILDGEVYSTCTSWSEKVLDELTGPDKPDVVVTSGQRSYAVAPGSDFQSKALMRDTLADTWQQIEDAGVEVVVLADNPQTGMEVYACASEHLDDLTACTFEREHGVEVSGAPLQRQAAEQAGVPFVDLTDWICPTEECAPVIGNVLIYRQGSHLTKTYIESLAPQLATQLAKAGVR